MRFKPKKIKKNTQGEEELEEEDEEIDQLAGTAGNTYSYLAAEEEDYIENANNELIKGNEKFMKDLKKKYEALAKLRAEMSPKKKEEKAPAEKKVAVEPAD
jgi:flagellin-like hook-associated protein FlgL